MKLDPFNHFDVGRIIYRVGYCGVLTAQKIESVDENGNAD